MSQPVSLSFPLLHRNSAVAVDLRVTCTRAGRVYLRYSRQGAVALSSATVGSGDSMLADAGSHGLVARRSSEPSR